MLCWRGVQAFFRTQIHNYSSRRHKRTFFQTIYSHPNKHTPAELAAALKLMSETKMLFSSSRQFTPSLSLLFSSSPVDSNSSCMSLITLPPCANLLRGAFRFQSGGKKGVKRSCGLWMLTTTNSKQKSKSKSQNWKINKRLNFPSGNCIIKHATFRTVHSYSRYKH